MNCNSIKICQEENDITSCFTSKKERERNKNPSRTLLSFEMLTLRISRVTIRRFPFLAKNMIITSQCAMLPQNYVAFVLSFSLTCLRRAVTKNQVSNYKICLFIKLNNFYHIASSRYVKYFQF
jgi:glucose uptake protein GlcU